VETTYESRPAIQKYLLALEARLQATLAGAAEEGPAEAGLVEAGLADAREFLLSEWDALRESGGEPADDETLYMHFVAKFGTPEEVAAGYGGAEWGVAGNRHGMVDLNAPRADIAFPNEPEPDRGCRRGAVGMAIVGAVLACGAVFLLLSREGDAPIAVAPAEPAARPPLGELRTSWAERVVSFRFGVDEVRDPQTAAPTLGVADCRNPESDPPTCISLGDGGELVVEFVTSTIVDGPGADLAVHEVGYFEPVRVAASENGDAWTELGVTDQRLATFDLAKAGLARARFVRVTDARTGRTNDLNSPGAEIDSIAGLNSVAVPLSANDPSAKTQIKSSRP
jgi:hypothetical protein